VTAPRLVLVRHGRSAHVHRGWIDRAGLDRWQLAYDAAGLHDADAPPPALVVTAQARAAADWLAGLARAHGAVVVVTHAVLRGHLAGALRRDGWSAPDSRSVRHWSAWTLTRAAG
jgi:hypothetical protein